MQVAVMRGGVARGFLIAAIAGSLFAGCGPQVPPPGERRILFCDDLRVRSVRPDGTGVLEFPGKQSFSPVPGPHGRVYSGSYRGPYLLMDEPKPGLYSTDAAQIGTRLFVEDRNGRAFRLTVPAAGFVIYE